MKISKQQLIDMNACKPGLRRFVRQTDNTNDPVEVSSLVGGKNTYEDLLWLAGKTLPTERVVKFACDVALINIELIKPYTDEFDLIVDFLNNPNSADATVAAAYAVAAARAYTATAAAAAAVARAAAAVADARAAADARAYAAARAAYYAARSGNEEKVNQLLIELFKGE